MINLDDFTLWSVENDMNSLCLFINLSELSLIEKMLIVRAHVIMKFRCVKKHQYKYIDHVINFVQNTLKIISQLFFLSFKLQVFLLKFIISITENSNANHQFECIFHVHHRNVKVWLIFLKEHHSNYANIVIDAEWLSQLSQKNIILNCLSCILQNDEKTVTEQKLNQDAQILTKESIIINIAFISDLITELFKLAQLRTELKQSQLIAAASHSQQTSFFMITLSSQPLNERDFSLHIACMIFSILFSIEVLFFNSVYLHVVTSLVDYHNHLMKYKDDRFAYHSQFRYWTFNSQLRKQICQISQWYTSCNAEKMNDINVLQEMIENSEFHLIDMIVCKTATVQNT